MRGWPLSLQEAEEEEVQQGAALEGLKEGKMNQCLCNTLASQACESSPALQCWWKKEFCRSDRCGDDRIRRSSFEVLMCLELCEQQWAFSLSSITDKAWGNNCILLPWCTRVVVITKISLDFGLKEGIKAQSISVVVVGCLCVHSNLAP